LIGVFIPSCQIHNYLPRITDTGSWQLAQLSCITDAHTSHAQAQHSRALQAALTQT